MLEFIIGTIKVIHVIMKRTSPDLINHKELNRLQNESYNSMKRYHAHDLNTRYLRSF